MFRFGSYFFCAYLLFSYWNIVSLLNNKKEGCFMQFNRFRTIYLISLLVFVLLFIGIFLFRNDVFSATKTSFKKSTVYDVSTRDEFYTILFDEAAAYPNEDILIRVKGTLAAKIEKEFDKYHCDDFNNLDVLNAKKYMKKYKNQQAFSYNDIACEGYLVDYDTKQDKKGKTNYLEVSFKGNGYAGKEVRRQYEDEARVALLNMELESLSDVQRVRTIVDWICANMEPGNPSKKTYCDSALALIDNKGDCGNYTSITTSMCDAIGLDVLSDEGDLYKNNSDSFHAWNIVKIHGKWYNMDVTWLDNGETFEDYFLKSGSSDTFKERNKYRQSDTIKKQYTLSDKDCVDDGYRSPLRAWLIGISDANVKTTVGKSINIQQDRLTKVTSSNTKVAVIKGNKIVTRKKGRTTITRTDGTYISQYYVLVK